MTAQTLIDRIQKLIEEEYNLLDKEIRKNLLSKRKEILEESRKLWDKAKVKPALDETVGNVVYVSKTNAYKYGRVDKLEKDIKKVMRVGAVTDIRNLEYHGKRIYQLEHNGMAWVYNQGYGLPITGGVKVPLIAQAVYSDFYGMSFDDRLKKNWDAYFDDIMGSVKRGLNQGYSYFQLGENIRSITDSSYGKALRIARTEAGRMQSMAYQDSLGLLDEVGAEYRKMWIATIDDATRRDHQEMDGKEADNRGIFHLPNGATGPAPRLTGDAASDINCRCSAIAIINGEKPTERRVRGEGIVPFETYSDRLRSGGNIPISALRDNR